jgi:ribosome-binding factor A
MSTGEVSPDILGLGLTISRVKISSDFSIVNVYWAATGTSKDDVIEPILKKAAGRLRYALTQLKVIGIVPPIEFVKDKTYSKIAEMEYLLNKCDLGEDENATPDSMQNAFLNNNNNIVNDSTIIPNDNTESGLYKSINMRQDVLGVRHDVIMMQVG